MPESTEVTTDYRSPSGLRDLLASVLEDLRADRISVKAANSIALVSNTILTTYRIECLIKKTSGQV